MRLGDQNGNCSLYQAVPHYPTDWGGLHSSLALLLVLLAYCNFRNSYFAYLAKRETNHVGGNQMRKFMEKKICKIKDSVRNYRQDSGSSLALITIVTPQLKNLQWLPTAQLIKLRFLGGAPKAFQSLVLPGPPLCL